MATHHLKPLSEVLEVLRKRGYTSDFMYRENKLRDMESGEEYSASDIIIKDEYRFEGDTNPDDMSILYALESTDGTKGTISTPYGADADVELDEFLNGAVWEA